MKRALRKSVSALGVLVLAASVVAAGFLLWAVLSQSGLRFVWQRVEPRLPVGVTVTAVEGKLAGPLVLGGITVQTDSIEARVERIELRWNLEALLDRTLEVETLEVRGVDIVGVSAAQPAAQSEPLRLPDAIDPPVAIRVRRASVETLRYRPSPAAEPLTIERASLGLRLDADRLELRELAVGAPGFDVFGEASVVPRGDYETAGRLDWTLRLGDYPEARGSTEFSGDLEALALVQRSEAPYEAHVDLSVEDLLGALRLDGQVTFAVRPAAFGIARVPAETVGSSMAIRGTLDALDLNGRVELEGGEAGGVAADIDARYAAGSVEIRSLDLVDRGSRAALHATGRVAVGGEQPVLDVAATWSALQWPLRGVAQVTSDAGSLELLGTLHGYTVALNGRLALADGTESMVGARGTGDAETLTLETVDIEALRGKIAGRLSARWAPSVGATIDLTGTRLDPGAVLAEWPGQLDARVRADAARDGEQLTIAVHDLEAHGRLRGRPLELSARGGYRADTLQIDLLELTSGATAASARGTAGNELALEWRVQSPDLGEVWPQLQGELSARGALRGPRLRPQVDVEARGRALRFMGYAANDVELMADVDVAGTAHSSLMLDVSGADVAGVALPRLQLKGDGNVDRHSLSLSTTTSVGNAAISLTGEVAAPWSPRFAWTFALDEATFGYPELAPWMLRAPATGRISRAEAELARSCWQSDAAELCLEGTRGPRSTRAQLSLSALRLDYFAALLAQPARLEGDLSVDGRFEQLANGTPRLDISLRTSPGRLVASEPNGHEDAVDSYALAFGPVDGRVTLNDDRWESAVRMPFAEQGELTARASIAAGMGSPFEDRALNGELQMNVASLEFVSNLVRQAQNTKGALTGNMQVSGTVGMPQVAGSLALINGGASLPGTNVEIEDVELHLLSDGGSGLSVRGRARSGGGTLSADGRLALAGFATAGRVAIEGDAFEVVDTVDAQIAVSPNLDLVLKPDAIEVSGSVLVPRARLTPRDTSESAVTASRDQVIVESVDEAEQATVRPFTANVRLSLGDEVTIDGYGLTGQLAGAIEVAEKPGEPTRATGELRVVQGVYEAYGQQLEVRTGRAVFAGGDISQPGVDIEAVRRPTEDVVVGARVRGLLSAPELSLFSEPPMAQQEQLSYLVLGRPLEDASASESSAMSRAALALGVRGGNFVSERINENLGLDSFGIQTDPGEAANEAAFVIGKYLTPSLYVSYGIGLFEPVNTLKLRYAFAKRWRLETESSSEASGGDLIYNIERGR